LEQIDNKDKLASFFKNGMELPLLPLRDIVIFPTMVAPLFVGREKSIRAVEHAVDNNANYIFLSAQKSANDEAPNPDAIYETGCISEIIQVFKMPDGTVKIVVEGIARATVEKYTSKKPFYMVTANPILDEPEEKTGTELEALSRGIKSIFEKFVKMDNRLPSEITSAVSEISNLEELANTVMSHVGLRTGDRQSILSERSLAKRLEMIINFLETEIEILMIEKRVKTRVKKQMDKSQKEYYLNEQMKAIHKELGRTDGKSEIEEFRLKIKNAKMPADIETKAVKELAKLEQMPPLSAEGTVVRNYLEWLVDIPWNKKTDDNLDTKSAQKILDSDHYGLEDVKERILDYLAVKKLSKTGRGPILCLVGPPGVGKTSLGKSIARSLGRNFVRVSLGGVRDEAEIRGHRRTYIGALPGRIIQSMKKAGSINPVMMLDEIDKMSMDFRGDPSSALLEVLDPEQNRNFSDHYLEVDYDLSEVMFITTANMLHNIPGPLRDRMEVLEIAGYTELEKLQIAKNFLIKKELKEHGLSTEQLDLHDAEIKKIISNYTREAGVRNLEREIATVCRKVARKVVEEDNYNVVPDAKDIAKYLGPEKFLVELAETHSECGFAHGLAWTAVGGEVMHTEVSIVPGKGKLTLTGKLGEVMKESAQAALTYIRSRSDRFKLDRNFYSKTDIHIHLPEGAIPKDGPSAGITMASAMVSAFCNIPVRHDVAMTGEVTLRGKVLPIGGLKEKALAAHRAGIKEVVFPYENEKDLEKIPETVRQEMKFTSVKTMDDVLNIVMTEPVFSDKKKRVRKKDAPQTDASPRPGIN